MSCALQGDLGEQANHELQRQQLRELLAKQTKQRQNKKKQLEEQERLRTDGGPVGNGGGAPPHGFPTQGNVGGPDAVALWSNQ